MEKGESRPCAAGEGLREGVERDQELRLALGLSCEWRVFEMMELSMA